MEPLLNWITLHTKGREQLARGLKRSYVGVAHAVWKERNTVIFEGATRDYENTAREIVCVYNVRLSGAITNLL